MGRFRFSIGGLMATVFYLGVSFAALRSGSEDWFRVMYTLTTVILFFAALAARYFGPFWFGFALFGWGYFLLGYGPWMTPGVIAGKGTALEKFPLNPFFVTFEYIIGFCYWLDGKAFSEPVAVNRVGITHCILTTLVALVGGYSARLFAATAAEGPAPTEAGTGPDSSIVMR